MSFDFSDIIKVENAKDGITGPIVVLCKLEVKDGKIIAMHPLPGDVHPYHLLAEYRGEEESISLVNHQTFQVYCEEGRGHG